MIDCRQKVEEIKYNIIITYNDKFEESITKIWIINRDCVTSTTTTTTTSSKNNKQPQILIINMRIIEIKRFTIIHRSNSSIINSKINEKKNVEK